MTDTMTADSATLAETMLDMGRRARAASRKLGQMTPADRTRGLTAVAGAIRADAAKILAANEQDMEAAREKGLDAAMLDRLALDAARLEGIASSVEAVAGLPDPIGKELARWERPNGLDIARVAVPLGVIGIIY
ncbi:MAG: gamma-glutamyl-phosphate reductase, partial [Hyphomonas sp.]